MTLTLRCRAYLNDDIESVANRHIDILRQIRNHGVRDYYRSGRPSEYDQNNKLKGWKEQWPVFKEPSAHAAQQAIAQIHNDIETLKERQKNGYNVGKLQWQGAGEFRSISYNQSNRFNVDHNTDDERFVRVRLEKIGWITVRSHRDIPDSTDIDEVVLKKEPTGEWYISFIVESPTSPEKPLIEDIDPESCVGIDLGILSYIHTSDNLAVGSLDLSDEYEVLRREQRKLSRKEHGSSNWEKQRQAVARAKRKVRRKVSDYQHKLSTWLVKTHDLVAVENLDVKEMLEQSHNARNKQDAAWRQFINLLKYKASLYGCHVVEVDPRGTTKECSECGVETAKPIWVREHSCPSCGHEEDRDLNAAKNVLKRGFSKLGPGWPESTPAETALPTDTTDVQSVSAKRVIETGNPLCEDGSAGA